MTEIEEYLLGKHIAQFLKVSVGGLRLHAEVQGMLPAYIGYSVKMNPELALINDCLTHLLQLFETRVEFAEGFEEALFVLKA